MELTQEDRKAFHNQADRVMNALDGVTEVNRIDQDHKVRVVILNPDENNIAILDILPRHQFRAETIGGELEDRVYRREDVVEDLNDILND